MRAVQELATASKAASRFLAKADAGLKNRTLLAVAQALEDCQEEILKANEMDLSKAISNGMSLSLQDRLRLTPQRICDIAGGVRKIVDLDDPVGEVIRSAERPNGLSIVQKRVPLGVVAVIYEARPNVTVDAAALCLKSGNSVILRGGKEAIHSNKAFADIMRTAIKESGLPEDCICLVEDTSRESAKTLMELRGYVDVLIPRGGAGLIRSVVENAKVPVIETGVGNCHVYVDDSADLEMAASIIYNAKCSRPSVCNAAETLLVSEKVAEHFLPMAKAMLDRKNTQLRGDQRTQEILGKDVRPVQEEDYWTEFGDYILAVKVVKDLDEAISHINRYGSGHSEAIITNDYAHAERFLREVDAAAVYVNASTRFTDGGEFGFGAEVGISTQKMHARGPMGLRELTTGKYMIRGNGQIR